MRVANCGEGNEDDEIDKEWSIHCEREGSGEKEGWEGFRGFFLGEELSG
jgi:hypothetical protein